jgi:hypothetical protein
MKQYGYPSAIQLTEAEHRLLDRISFDLSNVEHDEAQSTLSAAAELARSLMSRSAIPEACRRYFTEPALNVGSSRSHMEVFEANGTRGEAILRHPHFLKYLRYFIDGPALPAPSIAGFCRVLNEDAGTSGMVQDQLRRYVRSEVRKEHLSPPEAAGEFFKLAHELGLDEHLCRAVRDAARTTR